MTDFEKAIKENIINIYGVGTRGRRLYYACKNLGIQDKIQCFIVANKKKNAAEFDGIPIYDMDDNRINKAGSVTIVSLANRLDYYDVFEELISRGYCNIRRLSASAWEEISLINDFQYIKDLDNRCEAEQLPYDEQGFFHIEIPSCKKGSKAKHFWRLQYSLLQKKLEDGSNLFPPQQLLEAFESYYGPYRILEEEMQAAKDIQTKIKSSDKRYRVFMARSIYDRFEIPIELPEWLEPIQVGASLTEQRIAVLTDDTGDNISNLNRDFSEGTALYWIWKNVHDADYVGLFHYSRHMIIPDNDISGIADMDIDIVLTTPMFSGGPIRDFFVPYYIMRLDWKLMEESLLRQHPEYADTLELYNRAFCYPGANLSIMKKEAFDEYASFAFSILLDVAKYYSDRGIVREDRYAGYLLENLTALFAMHNKDRYKIAFTDFKYLKK